MTTVYVLMPTPKVILPVKVINGEPVLKETHQYCYQVQMQMVQPCRVPFTNLESDVKNIRVVFNEEFRERIRNKLLNFRNVRIVPALIAQELNKVFKVSKIH